MFTKFFTLAVLIFSGCCCSSLQAAAHQDWRILVNTCSGCGGPTSRLAITDLEIYDASGTYLPLGGTASASGSSGGTAPGNAFDRNDSTEWTQYGTPTSVAPFWLAYHFTSPKSVATVRLNEATATGAFAPTNFKFQYSDDGGTTWFDATGILIPMFYGDGQGGIWNAWSFTVDPPLGGYYVNWRIRATANNSGTGWSYTAITEMGIKDTIGGGLLTVPGSVYPFGSGNGSCCSAADNLLDSNLTTYVFSGLTAQWGYIFEKPYKVIEVDLTNENLSSWTTDSPRGIFIEGSNDVGMNWSTAFTCNPTWTAQAQTKVCGATLDQRGNIAYDQIRANDRQGAAHQFQMFGGGQTVPGHAAAYDGSGNVVDAGVVALGRITAPVTHTDPCTVGQIAIDGSGNWYWCYGTNLWARIGPGGYSNSF